MHAISQFIVIICAPYFIAGVRWIWWMWKRMLSKWVWRREKKCELLWPVICHCDRYNLSVNWSELNREFHRFQFVYLFFLEKMPNKCTQKVSKCLYECESERERGKREKSNFYFSFAEIFSAFFKTCIAFNYPPILFIDYNSHSVLLSLFIRFPIFFLHFLFSCIDRIETHVFFFGCTFL